MPTAAHACKIHAFLTPLRSALRSRSSCPVALFGLRRVGRHSMALLERNSQRSLYLPLHTVCRVCCNAQPEVSDRVATDRVPATQTVVADSHTETAFPAATSSFDRDATMAASLSARTLRGALFGLTDMHTSVTTHVDATERVARHMPLLEPWVRAALFEQSGWLAELTRDEAGSCGGDAGEPTTRRALDTLVGRPKLLRVLLLRFLQSPELWQDAVAELVECAANEASAHNVTGALGDGEGDAVAEGAVMAADGPLERALLHDALHHLTRPAKDVSLYGPGMRAKLEGLLTMTETSFVGPRAMWDAFVLARRHDTRSMPMPHCAPFSFGEVIPTIVPDDLELCPEPEGSCGETPPRRDDEGGGDSSTVGQLGEKPNTAAATSQEATSPPTTILSTEAWTALDTYAQNMLLFGKDAADYARRVRGYEGLHVAYHAGVTGRGADEQPQLPAAQAAEDDGTHSSSAAPSDTTVGDEQDTDLVEGDDGTCAAQTGNTARERHWARRARLYDTDRHYLGLVEPRHSSMLPLSGGPTAVTAASPSAVSADEVGQPCCTLNDDELLSGARVRNAVSGEVEDIQLARLWSRFCQAETAELINNYLVVYRKLSAWQAVLRHELAVQRAFLLLFWSRDEVRAVTKPAHSYATLWALHDALTRLFRTAAGDGAGSAATGVPLLPPFATLAAEVRVTFSCFGCSHLPQLSSHATADTRGPPADVAAGQLGKQPTSPVELYARCAARYATALRAGDDGFTGETVRTEAMSGSSDAQQMALWQALYEALNPQQRLAIDFCFTDKTATRDETPQCQDDESVASVAVDQDGRHKEERQRVHALVDEAIAELVYPTHTASGTKEAIDVHTEGIVLWLGGSMTQRQPTRRGRRRHVTQHC